jgi:hypothetical protein
MSSEPGSRAVPGLAAIGVNRSPRLVALRPTSFAGTNGVMTLRHLPQFSVDVHQANANSRAQHVIRSSEPKAMRADLSAWRVKPQWILERPLAKHVWFLRD